MKLTNDYYCDVNLFTTPQSGEIIHFCDLSIVVLTTFLPCKILANSSSKLMEYAARKSI